MEVSRPSPEGQSQSHVLVIVVSVSSHDCIIEEAITRFDGLLIALLIQDVGLSWKSWNQWRKASSVHGDVNND
ncbi:hypothetical protein F2Q69_00031554 [Brassica cretica]|uniref:Uncharacterized protein n=1 Tax=Brassica cretica TaxID=69181 RepID=A0A8S9RVH2_BRACR|nr:hypothetical protein F2Q69_00031554 [Brassica cretica]